MITKSRHYQEGYTAGLSGYRRKGAHVVPRSHPLGSTAEGVDWMLGCSAGLMNAEAQDRANNLTDQKPTNDDL